MKKRIYKIITSILCILLVISSFPITEVKANTVDIPTEVSINLLRFFSNKDEVNITVQGNYSNGAVNLEEGKTYTAKVDGDKISIYRGQTKLATSSEFNFSPKTYGESNVI